MQRRTIIVEGPLAFRMARAQAARTGAFDLDIMTLPQLAARLAGGFVRPASEADIDDALGVVLPEADLGDLRVLAQLPGMVRAARTTLLRLWRAPAGMLEVARTGRLAALADLDCRVRAALRASVSAPPDLSRLALQRVAFAPVVLGDIELSALIDIAPVWRELLGALANTTRVVWRNPAPTDVPWFNGQIVRDEREPPAAPVVVSCADARAEAVEALRWMRELIASGQALPQEIAITAPSTQAWDEHFLALAGEAQLPLHFSHGVPVLSTPAGQLCAALADILLHGLSQDRVRRLASYGALACGPLRILPGTWSRGIATAAGLFELAHWQAALDAAAIEQDAGDDPRPVLIPLLTLLAQGPSAAKEAGELVLGNAAREIWREALRRAPGEAIEYALQGLRAPDENAPEASVVWAPARHLLSAPRPWTRCLGLNTRSWPRQAVEDPLLPQRLLPRMRLDELSVGEEDRRALALLLAAANEGVVLSRSRRDPQGGRLSLSPLLPTGVEEIAFARTRVAPHAFSHADRLLARPSEARGAAHIARPTALWRSWRFNVDATEHDGLMRANHPMLTRALAQPHSATSLRQLLRDPLSFVWRYALGWQAPAEPEAPLALDARAYGELVHALLRRTVDTLQSGSSYMEATEEAISAAVKDALIDVADQWRVERSIPPRLLWRNTLYRAGGDALTILKYDRGKHPGAASWAEVRFGEVDAADQQAPWPAGAAATILDGGVTLRGSIDRLDVAPNRDAYVSDYKTGTAPDESGVIAGGADLQRVVYAAAVRALLPDTRRISARLLYLTGNAVETEELADADAGVAILEKSVAAARDALARGAAFPGPDARETWNDYRIALPATINTYLRRKESAFRAAFGALANVWSEP